MDYTKTPTNNEGHEVMDLEEGAERPDIDTRHQQDENTKPKKNEGSVNKQANNKQSSPEVEKEAHKGDSNTGNKTESSGSEVVDLKEQKSENAERPYIDTKLQNIDLYFESIAESYVH
ncbi:hypothetical protein DPMN_161421 [Dreissena polymorpha]|uniref:Uncharacterized protein n=1 Tax=Dreissena polymorpha TaxID=45954 RepID=A0A9D4ITE6_DREPO|nr:hypothetical protein DPMN_161421 [Dreissena polymorpha]